MACECCGCKDKCTAGLSLEEFREILCVRPYQFWTLGQNSNDHPGTVVPIADTPCSTFVFERCHQDCTIAGRDQICEAIRMAEQAFADYMGYWPSPQQECTEFYFSNGNARRCLNISGQGRFKGGLLQLKHNKVTQLGRLTERYLYDQIIDPSHITDTNSDALWDTATLPLQVVSGVTIDELVFYFQDEDMGNANCCRREIKPQKIVLSQDGTQWIATFRSWLLVKPHVYESYGNEDQESQIQDPQNITIYANRIQVFRRWVDPLLAVQIWRKPVECRCGRQAGDECYTCEATDACILSNEQGLVQVALPSTGDCGCCASCADRICISYMTGDCNQEALIARLAASYLHSNICCGVPNQIAYMQQDYVAVNERGKTVTTLSQAERSNPFGTKRGAVDAYRMLRRRSDKRMQVAFI